jgi:hypothetical protein
MKNKCTARNVSRRNSAPPLPDHCAIVVPGHNIEVSAIFKAWIYDEPEEAIAAVPRGKRHPKTISNQGIIEALRG